jgi:hypothetical protein
MFLPEPISTRGGILFPAQALSPAGRPEGEERVIATFRTVAGSEGMKTQAGRLFLRQKQRKI